MPERRIKTYTKYIATAGEERSIGVEFKDTQGNLINCDYISAMSTVAGAWVAIQPSSTGYTQLHLSQYEEAGVAALASSTGPTTSGLGGFMIMGRNEATEIILPQGNTVTGAWVQGTFTGSPVILITYGRTQPENALDGWRVNTGQ